MKSLKCILTSLQNLSSLTSVEKNKWEVVLIHTTNIQVRILTVQIRGGGGGGVFLLIVFVENLKKLSSHSSLNLNLIFLKTTVMFSCIKYSECFDETEVLCIWRERGVWTSRLMTSGLENNEASPHQFSLPIQPNSGDRHFI